MCHCQNIDKYRGISLFNCICKLFGNVILLMYKSQLSPTGMQFGRKKHYTSLCTLMYFRIIINQYTHNKSNVYSHKPTRVQDLSAVNVTSQSQAEQGE